MRIWFICIKCELKSWFEMNTKLSPVTKEDLICDDCQPEEKGEDSQEKKEEETI